MFNKFLREARYKISSPIRQGKFGQIWFTRNFIKEFLLVVKISKGGKMAKETIEFYDVKSKDKFKTADYKIVVKGGRSFAVTKSKSGSHECWRIVSKDFAAKNK